MIASRSAHRMAPVSARLCRALAVLCCLVADLPAATAAASAESADAAEEVPELEEVVVYGNDGRVVAGLYAESELDAEGIAAYGANTVGDLLGQVAPDVDNTEEGPVILINGRPANGIRSVNDLPSEAVASIQVLPPQAAAALGYGPTRRVINVVLKTVFQQRNANLTARGATAGQGFSANGNVGMVRLNGTNVRQFALRATRTSPLLEAHRHISSQPTGLPYDLVGNVLAWPAAGDDIDPDLSALVGQPVTVLGVPPGLASPALTDFVPRANIANSSDMGRYRTLVSDQYSYGFNANWGMQLPRNAALNFNLNADRSESLSRTGATTALLHVPASSPFTPFSRDVGIARYLGAPLRQQSDPTSVNLSGNLGSQLGIWRVQADTSVAWRSSTTVSGRRVDTEALQAAVDAGTVNPFDAIPADLLADVVSDRARSRSWSGTARLQAWGSLFELPAGKANTALRLEWRQNRQRSTTTGTSTVTSNRRRQDGIAYLSLQVPLLGGATPQGFALGSELSGSARRVTAAGTLYDHGYGLNWRKGNRLTMRIGINREKVAPQPEALTGPVITIDDFRAYDFIRQETVLVRYITGGNPDLGVGDRRITRIGGTIRPFAPVDLTLNADYVRSVDQDVPSALPPASEDVQAAFPDRYRRDAGGRLVEVDARLVSFARNRTEQLRWGGNFRRNFGVPAQASPAGTAQVVVMNDGIDLSGPGWRLSANFTHTWQLSNTRLARRGLPEVDLLSGGTGNGNGQSRHSVQSRMGLAYNGTGLQFTANWKSRSRITAGTASAPSNIVFSPYLRLDMSTFAELGTVFRGNKLLQGARVSLDVENLFDSRQRVSDQTGATPLRYQPYLINPLGRVAALSLRKTF